VEPQRYIVAADLQEASTRDGLDRLVLVRAGRAGKPMTRSKVIKALIDEAVRVEVNGEKSKAA
jgi:hypothetical protein